MDQRQGRHFDETRTTSKRSRKHKALQAAVRAQMLAGPGRTRSCDGSMCWNGEGATVHQALLRLSPGAERLQEVAGLATGGHILAHRIAELAQGVLRLMPGALASVRPASPPFSPHKGGGQARQASVGRIGRVVLLRQRKPCQTRVCQV